MPILNQPFENKNLGNIIIDKLNSSKKGRFIFFSAFAKTSGVLRIKDALIEFKKNGGFVQAFVGVDLEGTSYEALLNLFELCDELYIVHSELFSVTYHSKIYFIESKKEKWFAIGSNNMTGGGLWTNYESCYMNTLPAESSTEDLSSIINMAETFADPLFPCSKKIRSIDDVVELLEEKYIAREIKQHIDKIRTERKLAQRSKKLFGAKSHFIPKLGKVKNISAQPKGVVQNHKSLTSVPSFENECFWFEMRKSTGGSRNILDLSKSGKIQKGSVNGTSYSIPNEDEKMQGGVKFFGLDPDNTSKEKDIVINYEGTDFYCSTIKFAPDNGSWRIQLKGKAKGDSDVQDLSRYGNQGEFVNKILFFEKISDDYYVLSLMEDSELDAIKAESKVWALNGNGKNSKAFGMI